MIGFELTKGNKTIVATLKSGVISVIIDRIILDTRNYISISFGGYNTQTETYPRWYEEQLFLGDKLIIKVKEIDKNSPIIVREDEIQNHFFNHPKNIGIELSIKDKKVSATVIEGSIHLIATILNNREIDLDFLATNHFKGEDNPKKYWYRNPLQLGDEFIVEIKEIEKNTILPETE